MRHNYIRSNTPLTHSQLSQAVPSAYAVTPWSHVSKKYSFLNTAEITHALEGQGLGVFSARQSGTRIEDKRGHTKHSLRFRPLDSRYSAPLVGEVFPEVLLTNSGDRSSSFIVEMGLYRLACSNGLVISIGSLSSYRVRHVSNTIENVLQAVNGIISQFPQVTETVERLKATTLTLAERQRYAELALGLRYDANRVPFHSSRLLETRRHVDAISNENLWGVFNTVQENLLQGQQRRTRMEHTSRAVRGLDVDLSLNRGLWQLTQSFL